MPIDKLFDLYEQVFAKALVLYYWPSLLDIGQIILELLELREGDTARAMLRNTKPMQQLKIRDWERYRKIEDLLARTYFDAKDVSSSSCMWLNAIFTNVHVSRYMESQARKDAENF